MELLDFSKGDYPKQLQNLQPRFTPIEYKAVNPCDIDGFFKSELGQRAINSKKVVKEFKLYTEIGLEQLGITDDCRLSTVNCFVQGIADMFFYENGEIVLIDYKTNRNTSSEKLAHDYRGQLTVYKKAIEEMTGVRVAECWIYSFEKGAILL